MFGIRRARAVMGMNKESVSSVLGRSHIMVGAIDAHAADYPNLPISTTAVASQAADVEEAQKRALSRIPGAAAERDVMLATLCASLELYRAHIQHIADENAEKAVVLIQNAGLRVAAPIAPPKPVLGAYLTPQGVVVLRANAKLLNKGGGTFRCFNWQHSTDGGKSWTTAPSTPFAETTISGLPTLTLCEFRVSVTNRNGQSEWSQAIRLLTQ